MLMDPLIRLGPLRMVSHSKGFFFFFFFIMLNCKINETYKLSLDLDLFSLICSSLE